jgi:hypothetical protein
MHPGRAQTVIAIQSLRINKLSYLDYRAALRWLSDLSSFFRKQDLPIGRYCYQRSLLAQ